jgi:hypothetical protein
MRWRVRSYSMFTAGCCLLQRRTLPTQLRFAYCGLERREMAALLQRIAAQKRLEQSLRWGSNTATLGVVVAPRSLPAAFMMRVSLFSFYVRVDVSAFVTECRSHQQRQTRRWLLKAFSSGGSAVIKFRRSRGSFSKLNRHVCCVGLGALTCSI